MLIQLACLTPQFCKWTFFTWNISVIFRTFQKKTGKNTVNPKLVGGLEHCFFFHIGNVISPTDIHSIIFQRGRSTTNQQGFSDDPSASPEATAMGPCAATVEPCGCGWAHLDAHRERRLRRMCQNHWFPARDDDFHGVFNRQARCLPGTWSPRPIRRTWGGRISWSEQVFSPAVVYEIASSLITNVGKTMSQTTHDWECMIVLADAASKDSSPFANVCNVVLLHVIFAMFFSHARSAMCWVGRG